MSEHTLETRLTLPANDGVVFDVGSLMCQLDHIQDPRQVRGVRYSLVTLLVLLILAKLGGEDGMKGIREWVKLRGAQLLHLPRQTMPHQTTDERVLDGLDEAQVQRVLGRFFAQKRPEPDNNLTISIDGKILRGSIPVGKTQGTHLLAAYAPELGVVLMQVEVESKVNEIVAAPRLLASIDLTQWVVTGDALFTQRELCIQSVQAGGHFVFPVKANQSSLQRAIADPFLPAQVAKGHQPIALPESATQTVSSGHGRIEQRYLTVSSELNDYLDFPHVQQVFRLQRVVQQQSTGTLTYQVMFGITSLSRQACPPKRLMTLIRHHWQIENRLHYVRDVTFHEDACRVRVPKRQRLLAALNNLAIGLSRQCADFTYAPEARRYFSLHYDHALQLLL